MKRMIKIMLSILLLMEMAGCRQVEESHKTEDDVQIESFDYGQYRLFPVTSYMGSGKTSKDAEKKVASFNNKVMNSLLNDKDNNVYSPFNLYLNFCALSSLTDGTGRDELYALLDTDEAKVLTDYQTLWTSHYMKVGKRVCVYNNSFWLNEKFGSEFNADLLKQAADDYFAETYEGDMGDPAMTKAFQSWLNDNTGSILGNHISELKLEPSIMLALASTIYYEGRWYAEYDSSKNTMDVFHGVEKDVKTETMHKLASGFYVEDDNFTGSVEMFGNGDEYMAFIMPDKGTSVTDVLNDEKFRDFLTDPFISESIRPCILDISMPKYDADSKFKMEEILPELGVSSIFNAQSGTFARLTDMPLAVDKIEHACRLILDEQGIKAAAYTVETMYGGSPTERATIKFDRPFIFIVYSGNCLMFIGVINQL